MLSLENAMDEKELRAFYERLKKGLNSENNISIIAEPKLDGLGVELVYENGVFVRGSTPVSYTHLTLPTKRIV